MDLKLQTLRQEVKQFRKKSGRVTRRILALIELTKFRKKWRCVSERDHEQIDLRREVGSRTGYAGKYGWGINFPYVWFFWCNAFFTAGKKEDVQGQKGQRWCCGWHGWVF